MDATGGRGSPRRTRAMTIRRRFGVTRKRSSHARITGGRNPTGPLARMPCRCLPPHPPSAARPSGSSRSTARPGRCGAGSTSLEGDLPAAIVRIDANATAAEVRNASALATTRGRGRRVDPRGRAGRPGRGAGAASCPDVVLDSALCGDELVESAARLDERVRPRRPAHRPVARRDRARERRRRARSTASTASTCSAAAPTRGASPTGSRPASRCRSGSWATSPGSRACGCASARTSGVVPPPALEPSASLGDALDLVACGHELVRALQGSAARLRRAEWPQRSSVTGLRERADAARP